MVSSEMDQIRRMVRSGDVRGALKHLNGLTDHRFTALYRFDDETLRSQYFFDRENPEQEATEDIPVLASYCVYVRDTADVFEVGNSLTDPRVAGHPKRQQVLSYCGVPLCDVNGQAIGSICHFDFQPVASDDTTVALLEAAAAVLSGQG